MSGTLGFPGTGVRLPWSTSWIEQTRTSQVGFIQYTSVYIISYNFIHFFYVFVLTGSTCKDPGRPADGEQHGDSYEEGSLITFSCFRPGFKLSNPYPLKCLYNGSLNWNATVPQCVGKGILHVTEVFVFKFCIRKSLNLDSVFSQNMHPPRVRTSVLK